MGKLTINELSKSLLGYLQPKQDESLTTEDKTIVGAINEVANKAPEIDLNTLQPKQDDSLNTSDKTVIGAINELFQNANNGKELIANAIGEPLEATDTFSAMSENINGLLTSFKTNMTNSGVTVEETDKFKQLIDKVVLLNQGLNIISATALPENIIENQVVVVTSNSTNKIIISRDEPANPTKGLIWIKDIEKSPTSTDYTADLTDSMTVCYNLKHCYQYDGSSFTEVTGYIGIDNVWQPLKKGFTILSKNGYDNSDIVVLNNQYNTGWTATLEAGKGLYFYWNTSGADRTTQYLTSTKINFSEFSKLVLKYNLTATTNWTAEVYICLGYGLDTPSNYLNAQGSWTGGQIQYTNWSSNSDRYAWNDYVEYEGSMEFDISSLSSEYYIGFTVFVDTPTTLYIESIELL